MTDESSQNPPADPQILPPEPRREEQTSSSPEEALEEEGTRMSFLDHLEELRWRLLKSLAAVLVGAAICYIYSDELVKLLTVPYEDAVRRLDTTHSSGVLGAIQRSVGALIGEVEKSAPIQTESLPEGRQLQALKVMTTFFVPLQIALLGGLVLALPVIFYQLWQFVAPGLLSREKRLMLPIVGLSVLCFAVGALVAYSIVLPLGLHFFLALEPPNTAARWALGEYVSFVLRLILGFGLVFEMPVLTFFLSRIGVLTADYLRRVRRYALVAVFVLAAVFTPPDPISQIMMALPLLVLYEISIWVCKVSSPGNRDQTKKAD